jgi:hypothetical protein
MEAFNHNVANSGSVVLGEFLEALCQTNCSTCLSISGGEDFRVDSSEVRSAFPIIYLLSLVVYALTRGLMSSGKLGDMTLVFRMSVILQSALGLAAYSLIMRSGVHRLMEGGWSNEFDCEDCQGTSNLCDYGGGVEVLAFAGAVVSFLVALFSTWLVSLDDHSSCFGEGELSTRAWIFTVSALGDFAIPAMSTVLVAQGTLTPECRISKRMFDTRCAIRFQYHPLISIILITNVVGLFISASFSLLAIPGAIVAVVSRLVQAYFVVVLRMQLGSGIGLTIFNSIQPFFMILSELMIRASSRLRA